MAIVKLKSTGKDYLWGGDRLIKDTRPKPTLCWIRFVYRFLHRMQEHIGTCSLPEGSRKLLSRPAFQTIPGNHGVCAAP